MGLTWGINLDFRWLSLLLSDRRVCVGCVWCLCGSGVHVWGVCEYVWYVMCGVCVWCVYGKCAFSPPGLCETYVRLESLVFIVKLAIKWPQCSVERGSGLNLRLCRKFAKDMVEAAGSAFDTALLVYTVSGHGPSSAA